MSQKLTDPHGKTDHNQCGTGCLLSPGQELAARLVAVGKRDQEVAEALDVTRETVNRWRNHHPTFRARLEALEREAWEGLLADLRADTVRARETLREILDDNEAPVQDRRQAAQFLLRRYGPEEVEDPGEVVFTVSYGDAGPNSRKYTTHEEYLEALRIKEEALEAWEAAGRPVPAADQDGP